MRDWSLKSNTYMRKTPMNKIKLKILKTILEEAKNQGAEI